MCPVLLYLQELADGSVHGGGGGHPAAVHAGRGPACVSWCPLYWGRHQGLHPTGDDEDGEWLFSWRQNGNYQVNKREALVTQRRDFGMNESVI